jgi:hypothetical protein
MSLSSLPQFPVPESPPPGTEQTAARRLPQPVRILINLGLAAALVTMVFVTRAEAEKLRRSMQVPISPEPIKELGPTEPSWDFECVAIGYDHIRSGDSRQQVEALIGPPTYLSIRDREVWSWEYHLNRGPGPNRRIVWSRWVDPDNPGTWVTIPFEGDKVLIKIWNQGGESRVEE